MDILLYYLTGEVLMMTLSCRRITGCATRQASRNSYKTEYRASVTIRRVERIGIVVSRGAKGAATKGSGPYGRTWE
jgi:hypothetical protein